MDDPSKSCPCPLRAGGSPESGKAGTRHGLEDSGGSPASSTTWRNAIRNSTRRLLVLYKLVQLSRQRKDAPKGPLTVFVSYDEKPGIQAIGGVAPDLPPKPGKHVGTGRDYEYQRHGNADGRTGSDKRSHTPGCGGTAEPGVRGLPAARAYPAGARIRLVLDNHSAHVSKETRACLATMANRFEFVFTPKHGSWLNVVESFFAKLANTLLSGWSPRRNCSNASNATSTG